MLFCPDLNWIPHRLHGIFVFNFHQHGSSVYLVRYRMAAYTGDQLGLLDRVSPYDLSEQDLASFHLGVPEIRGWQAIHRRLGKTGRKPVQEGK